MMKDDELWLKKIKKRLDDYSEPLPAAGWERLEKALPVFSPISAVGAKKKILFHRRAMTAAAVALVAVSSIGLWLLQSPVIDNVRRAAEPALATMPDAVPEPARPSIQGKQPEPAIRRVAKRSTFNSQSLVAQHLETETKTQEVSENTYEKNPAAVVAEEKKATEQMKESESSSAASEKRKRKTHRPSSKDKLHLPVEKKSSEGNKGWAIGMSVGNTGGPATLDDASNGMQADPNSSPLFSNKLDLPNVSNGVLDIPEGEEIVFEGGIPYLRKNTRQIKNIKHKQPVSFGVSVRKALPKNFSVETGLTYTMLASEITYEGETGKADQKLHYIGIPIRANWNFVNNKYFTLYVSAGGTIEKCIYGKIANDKETVKPIQLSVMGAVGAQYNISNRVGIYVEPGVSHFFDDGSPVETIRKENPTNFTLQAGIRLTY